MSAAPIKRRSRQVAGTILLACAGLASWRCAAEPAADKPTKASRAEVEVVSDPGATEAYIAQLGPVRRMVEKGLCALTRRATSAAAWHALIRTNDIVGFKVTSAPGATSGTRPEVARALVESLLAAGHPAGAVVIWDRRMLDLRRAGWPALAAELGVRCEGAEDVGWDRDAAKYTSPVAGRLVYGDLDFGLKEGETMGRDSHITRLLTHDLTRVITVAPDLSHNYAGVNGHLVSLSLGSVDNVLRFSGNAPLLAEAVPEICALDPIIGKVAFGVTDALVCQYRGEETTLLHYAQSLNELRFSKDLVALDSLSLADIEHARLADAMNGEKPFKTDLFSNAEAIELGLADRSRINIRRP